ncbi:MAG: YfhO family protein, partial [Lachnospiraceae bacterium]|nr:YfhO family protein [Lachnospiraceae bacterium]
MLNEKRKTLFIYTVFFAIGVGVVFLPLWLNHKSLLRYSDGLDQYYYTLCYIGEWLRRIVRSIFVEFQPAIPKWDLSIGLGSDIIGTLHYYGLGDPLNLLAVFVPLSHMEALYTFLLFLRMYLAGLSFMVFCRYRKLPEEGLSVCALVYVFSGFMLMAGVRWVSFMWPFIAFPLILYGIDRAFSEKKFLPFTLATLLAAVSGIYFFYMQTILAGVYGLSVAIHKKFASGLKEALFTIAKLTVAYIVALLLSLPILYPVIEKLLANERVGLAIDIPRLFDTAFYKQLLLFATTITDIYNDNGIPLGVAPVVLAAIMAMVFGWKQKKWAWITLLLCLAAIGLPYFSHVMNGFGYVVHRWTWVFCLVMAHLLADNWEALQRMRHLQMMLMAIVHVAFAFYLYRMMEPSAFRLCMIA